MSLLFEENVSKVLCPMCGGKMRKNRSIERYGEGEYMQTMICKACGYDETNPVETVDVDLRY